MIERKIKNAPQGQGTVRMIDREEWDECREVRPRTPFESKLARPNAQIRTGEPVRKVNRSIKSPILAVSYQIISSLDDQTFCLFPF